MAFHHHCCKFILWTLVVVCHVNERVTAEHAESSFIEVIIPTLATDNGNQIEDSIEPHLHSYSSPRQRRSLPQIGDSDTFELSLNLTTSPLHLTLHRLSSLVASRARTEWIRGNSTVASPIHSGCLFEGRVHSSNNTIGMFSLCDGIAGVIVTSQEDIYLRPSSTGVGINRPHVAYHHPHDGTSSKKHQDKTQHRQKIRRNRIFKDSRRGKRGSQHRASRGKRSLKDLYRQGPKYIEVLLATDYTVVDFHGPDLVEQYLLTIMSIVNKIYHHPSLGVTFHVIVVRILILEDDIADDLFVKGSAKRTLDRFCAWTYANQPSKYPYEDQHDVAVYITRRDIGPAGYAPVTGMCNSVRSCTIAKDDGISSAFVIAHEMGHVFGMHHDGDGNECDADPSDGKIMSSMVQAAYDRFYWTDCSIAKMNLYLEDYHCLDNKPLEPGWPTFTEPFGQGWNLDEQCGQEFGKSYRLCQAFDNLDPCEFLWCSETDTPLLCKTKRGPPLPGTPCAPGKWCMKGRCEWVSDEDKKQATWSKWSAWGDCSRTCDTGVKFRYRSCQRENSGDNCEGDDEEFRLCSHDPCPVPQDFRAEQCSWMNSRKLYKGKKHTWLPMENTDKSKLCKLTCVSKETEDIIVTLRDVIDGTLCSYGIPNDICITGKCQRIGCDRKMGSDMKEDRCGVCGGYGNTCKVVADRFTQHQLAKGVYHKTITLPKGARNIIVEEAHDNHHFLAIRHDQDLRTFILNGRKKRGGAKIFVLHGTKFVYIPTRDGDSLTAKGPIRKDIDILVFNTAKRMAVVIDYEFTMPNDFEYTPEYINNINTDLEPIQTTYVWKLTGWTECSKTCGEGETIEIYNCMDDNTQEVVTKEFCNLMEKPAIHATTCNLKPCQLQTPYRWESGEWQPCSASCGIQGHQSRHVSCISNFYGKDQAVDPRYCNLTKVPRYHRRCNSHRCPASWRKTQWSKCSVTCGSGSQNRMVFCDKPRDGNNYECPGDQPTDTRICEMKSCIDKEPTTPLTTSQTTLTPEEQKKRLSTKADSRELDTVVTTDLQSQTTQDNNPSLVSQGGSGDDSENLYGIGDNNENRDSLPFDESKAQAVSQIPTFAIKGRPTNLEKLKRLRHSEITRKHPHLKLPREALTLSPPTSHTKKITSDNKRIKHDKKSQISTINSNNRHKISKIKEIITKMPPTEKFRQMHKTSPTTESATSKNPLTTIQQTGRSMVKTPITNKLTEATRDNPEVTDIFITSLFTTQTPAAKGTRYTNAYKRNSSEITTHRTIKTSKFKKEENSVEKSSKEPPSWSDRDRQCRLDKSFFCRLANHSNCAIPVYREMCCRSCALYQD